MKHYYLYLTIDMGFIVFKSLFALFEWYFLVGSWFKDSTNLFEFIFYGMLFIGLVTELFDFWNRDNYHSYNGGDIMNNRYTIEAVRIQRNRILRSLVRLEETRKFYKTEKEYKSMLKRLIELDDRWSKTLYELQRIENEE